LLKCGGTQPLAADGMSHEANGWHDFRCTMRGEFASYSFLAVTVAGFALLCFGLLALAFN
jgi:hypothetical protein